MTLNVHKVAVVGVGAVGVSVISHLVDDLIARNSPPTEILAFERGETFGPGVAYQRDISAAILNRTASSMSALPGKPSHFADWLRVSVQDEAASADYLPRAVFGQYLQDTLASAVVLARASGHRVTLIKAGIDSIVIVHDRYVLSGGAETWHADHVVLATGNLPKRHFRALEDEVGYFHTPYPLATVTGRIQADQTVAIIGSRLSAVDTVIALDERGHRGPLALLSRSGHLPSVQVPQASWLLCYCTLGRVRRLIDHDRGQLTLKTVFRLVLKELSLAAGHRFSVKGRKPKGDAAVDILRRDIEAVRQAPQRWQAALVALNAVIGDLWHALSVADQRRFRTLGYSLFMSIRVPIPLSRAETLLALLMQGRVDLRGELKTVLSTSSGFVAIFESGATKSYDVVIDATSADNRLEQASEPLYAALQTEQLIASHPMGGVDVHFSNNRAIATRADDPRRMYVVGNMTCGTYLFCSVYEVNTMHCARVSRQIVSELAEAPLTMAYS